MRWFNRPPLTCGHINGKKVQDFFCNADRFEDQKASRSKSHNNQPVMLLRLVNHSATWNDVARIYTCTSFIVTCFSCHSGHLSFFSCPQLLAQEAPVLVMEALRVQLLSSETLFRYTFAHPSFISRRQFSDTNWKTTCSSRLTCSENYLRANSTEVNFCLFCLFPCYRRTPLFSPFWFATPVLSILYSLNLLYHTWPTKSCQEWDFSSDV